MRQPYSSKLEIPVPVSVSFEIEGESEPATGWIARLSLAGVDIESLHIPPIGSKIVFHAALDPASSEVLTYTGRVRWVAGAKIGIQFAELGAKETHSVVEAMRAAGDGSVVSERTSIPRPQSRSGINFAPPAPPPPRAPAAPVRAARDEEKIDEIPITFDEEG